MYSSSVAYPEEGGFLLLSLTHLVNAAVEVAVHTCSSSSRFGSSRSSCGSNPVVAVVVVSRRRRSGAEDRVELYEPMKGPIRCVGKPSTNTDTGTSLSTDPKVGVKRALIGCTGNFMGLKVFFLGFLGSKY